MAILKLKEERDQTQNDTGAISKDEFHSYKSDSSLSSNE